MNAEEKGKKKKQDVRRFKEYGDLMENDVVITIEHWYHVMVKPR